MPDAAEHPAPLRVALLQCGHVHEDLVPEHGDYPELFSELFAGHGLALTTIDAATEALPAIDAFDGWLVSGSACSASDPLPWIPALEDLLRALVAVDAPIVAVCFGHQVLAQAMGGRVARSTAGWGAGAHRYEIVGPGGDPPPAWMAPPAPDGTATLIASHQDQVVELPEGARVWLRTAHCPVAGYLLGPAALAIQPHPEFTSPISRGLVERRRDLMGTDVADAALASLDAPLDRDLLASWMARFLRLAADHRAPAAPRP
ncbi:MAG: hypothetical protein R2702_01060 [Acidimicrobiales bacterium]